MGLRSGEPGAPGGGPGSAWPRWSRWVYGVYGAFGSPPAQTRVSPCCCASHPAQNPADSWQLRAPPVGGCGAAVPPPYGGVVPRVFKGSSRWARLAARAPCSRGVCDSVTVAQAMESGHGEVMDTCGAELERARSRERPP